MNKKGSGIIGFIFTVIVFCFLWAVWLGNWLVDVGKQAIIDGQLTGFEAFFYANLNMVVFICLVLGIMGFLYFAGGE